MSPARLLAPVISRLRGFVRGNDGISAVEFAIVLPFMIFLYVGGVEAGEALAIDYKTTITARAVADLATQYVSINNTTMATILGASSQIIAPYPTATIVVTVSEVSIDANGKATIAWSDSLNGTARPVGQVVTLPTAIDTANTWLIWGEVTYSYTPQIGQIMIGTWPIYENVLLYPRLSSSITRLNS
ncbi:MAG: TadE/TadG family type IV pilus assembly protein [Xanthobacteraceae bacterium]|jgi:Flp pilus assembly protein TadG